MEEAKADAFIQDEDGYTAFHWIAQRGWLDLVKYLAKKNPAGVNIKDNNGDTALDWAQKYCVADDCSSVIEYLTIEKLKGNPSAVNEIDSEGGTIFHKAAQNGWLDLIKYLVKKNPESVDITNNKGETALYLAAWKGRYEVVKYLVEEAKADAFIKEGNGWTAFHEIAQWGWLDLVKSLVKKNPSAVNIRTNKSGTALDIAENICYEGADCSGVVEYLKTFNSWIHILF